MARFSFHLRDGSDILLDLEGRELAGTHVVSAIALVKARSIISDDALGGKIMLGQRVDVEGEAGQLIYGLSFGTAVTVVHAHES